MENSRISVIVPVYNAEKYIGRCVESILNQTYSNIELILVNDGSNDKSLELLREYEQIDSRVVLVDKPNSGVADARNAGIEISTGEYIGFVDADDYIEPEMYEILHKAIVDESADIVCCGYKQQYKDFYYLLATESKKVLNGVENILSYYLRQDIRSGIGDGNWNKLFKRESIDSIRYKKYANGEDIEFQYNVFKNSNRMVCIQDILYCYVMNDNSAANSEFSIKKNSIIMVSDYILNDVIEYYNEKKAEAYAFNLTWKLSLLQNIYQSRKTVDSMKMKAVIVESLKKNKNYYMNNQYSKRLDQFYLKAALMGIMKQAMIFRDVVRKILPSKDKKI